ncbi:MAG TPA: HAD family hydrolase [Vicinamibacteria bacterium]|nr:HAD family hydrolase [Vicinamibacteria bacterium]
MRPPIAAVVLDFDGLILDTETPVFEAWCAAFRRHGQELSLLDWQHALGTNGGFDPMARLAALAGGGVDRAAVLAEVQEANRRACDAQPLLPGVQRLLAEAEGLGLGRAVASSSSRAWVEGWLTRHGIRERFPVVCGRDDVVRVKPAPDLFLLAAERLGVPPAACLVFEDSPNGMRAARAAGMRCVAVPNALTRRLALPDPDLVLGSLDERPLGAILAELASRGGR